MKTVSVTFNGTMCYIKLIENVNKLEEGVFFFLIFQIFLSLKLEVKIKKLFRNF